MLIFNDPGGKRRILDAPVLDAGSIQFNDIEYRL